MKTVDEILDNWDEEQYNDWFAVDQYIQGKITRLFVGEEDAVKSKAASYAAGTNLVDSMGEPAEPGWDGVENAPFYRAVLIPSDEAKSYFEGIMEEQLTDWITRAHAAEILGVTRGRITQLVDAGKLDTLGKLVSRADVEARLK